MWLALWSTDVPNKAKVHTWRLMHNGLAVGAELHRRRIKGGVFCVACGRDESIYHRFWACPHSQIWRALREEMEAPVVTPPELDGSFSSISSWMQDWLADATDVERETMIQALYGLWLARNEVRDGQRIADARTVARRVCAHMSGWREVHPKGACAICKNSGGMETT